MKAIRKRLPHQVGRAGEAYAIRLLSQRGFTIQACNVQVGRAEIDIIARKGELLAFIEVKTRKHHAFGYPESFVSDAQQDLYHQAATTYMDQLHWATDIRFDIIAIEKHPYYTQCFHFEDAF
ncbi:MAG: YraN family protein [Bacteroidota bacterium]